VHKQETAPVMVLNVIPLCSSQYRRLYNTTRIPGKESDRLLTLSDSTHIVVMHKGKFYRVGCYKNNMLLEPAELQLYVIRKMMFISNYMNFVLAKSRESLTTTLHWILVKISLAP
jgi:hypothetical protein